MLRSTLAVALLATPATAEELTFATWNISGAQKSEEEIRSSINDMVAAVGTPDVVALQEIISVDQVSAAAEALGHAFWVISDFSPPPNITGSPFGSLEVAVISRVPIVSAGEWDTTGQEDTGDNFAPRPSSQIIPTEELEIAFRVGQVRPSRGFLRVDLENGPSVYSVHWKSSRGESCNADDVGFAMQREDQAGGLVEDATALIATGGSVVVMGDFNIQAPGRIERSGFSAMEDCNPTGSCMECPH